MNDDEKQEAVVSSRAPEAVGAFPHARRVGNLLFLSGMGPRKRGTKDIPGVNFDDSCNVVDYDIAAQTLSVFENVRTVLVDAAGTIWSGHEPGLMVLDPASGTGTRLVSLVGQLVGFPRHLGQHVGGMVMRQGRLTDLVPVQPATMPGRTIVQWDKNDLDELGILKVDCLALGMLTAIHRAFDLVEKSGGPQLSGDPLPPREGPW